MSTVGRLTSIWENVKEIELKPIAAEALQELSLAIVGRPGSGRHTLAGQMRTDPQRPSIIMQSPLLITDLDQAASADRAQLILLMLDINQEDVQQELNLAHRWLDTNKKVIIFFNKLDQLGSRPLPGQDNRWSGLTVFHGSAIHAQFLQRSFVPVMLRMLPDQHLALGRQFPLFRHTIARSMIQDTSLSNAAYALSTGLAETVPVLDIPLNVADIFILTKAQAFLVYRLGLLLGYTTRWQDYVSEFGGVIGTGFLWRQISRQLVGLIPVWGIAPKVAVSYAGTYVVGHSVLQWYLTGRHIDRAQINALYRQAFKGGKSTAARLMSRLPKVHLLKRPSKALPPPVSIINCVHCGKPNAADANFCQYCGQNL
ncbi:MAG: zinc-ribbon domain-containing protein [Anaerolineales bacterium]|jgi:uncharacterized protein (DUF697 family)|nr:zinc-ribbon domain-containing protein [Anaerolineales bacterium]